jgi:WD40 repeat protein
VLHSNNSDMAGPSFSLALERFSSFGDLLKFLRRRAGLTQRELSIAVGYSHAQISRLELNQRPPDLATVAARFIPALDLEGEPAMAARLVELASALPPDEAPAPGVAPFKGLHYFEEADAGRFFGRETLTAALLERVQAALVAAPPLRFLAVVGASGSGKSSVVRAGLIPALRRSQTFAGWPIRCFTPTARPLQALAAALTQESASVAATATLMDDLARDRRALHLAAARLASEATPGMVLVIDQFEEFITLCRDETERRAFIDNLMTATTEPGGTTCLVLALRADFYASCAPYAALREALSGQQAYIGPMSAEELRRAIEEPARRDRWELEPGLVDLLLQDVGADTDADHPPEPGALPLLSHALLETWGRRRGRTLTVSGYLASGGVRGAIAETADTVYHDQLNAPQQAIARNIFLRLTQLGEGEAAETRRRATFEELMRQPDEAPAVREVLTRLADARLITTDNEVVEVAHEALIREWRTLRGWLEEDRESLRLHRHLTLAAEGWQRHGRDPGELYRGARLAQVASWAGEHSDELSGLERAFMEASQELVEREAVEREAQRQRELEAARTLAETQRRAAAQLRRRALYLSGAFILALGLAGAALFLGNQAQKSAVAAQDQQRIAHGRELAAAAISNLDVDAERSLLLALQAVSTTRTVDGSVLPEAEEALHRSLLGSQVRLTLTGHSAWVIGVAYSPDGKVIASIERDGTAIIWDAASGAELLRLPGATEVGDAWGAQRIAFSPDGRRLAIADSNLVKLYEPVTGDLLATLSGHTADVWAVAYSPDGRLLVSAGADSTVRLWNAESGALIYELTGHTDAVESAVFSPDSRWLATNADDGTLKIWDTATGQLVEDVPDVSSIGFSPDGTRLATTGLAGLQVWQMAPAGTAGGPLPANSPVLTIEENAVEPVFTPDGAAIAAVSANTVKAWDARTGRELLNLAGHTSWVTSFALSPDGQRLASASFDKTVRVWSLAPGQEGVTVRGTGLRVVYSPDGKLLTTDGLEGTARLWDAATGELRLTLPAHTEQIWAVAFSPDGQRLATASADNTAKVWDIASGQLLATMTGHEFFVRDVAFSPDGTRIATASFDQTARVWDAATGRELLKLTGHTGLVLGIAYSPDGQRIATSSADRTAKVWDANTGQLLFTLTGHTDPEPDVAFSPDGSLIATSSQDATAILWDAATGERRLTLTGHTAEIQSVAFSPDSKLLATGSGDNTAKIWDVATGQELHTLYGNQGGVSGVAFSPQDGGAHLAVASTDGVVRVYLLKIDDLLALAESRVTRSLSLEECQKYLHVAACP